MQYVQKFNTYTQKEIQTCHGSFQWSFYILILNLKEINIFYVFTIEAAVWHVMSTEWWEKEVLKTQ